MTMKRSELAAILVVDAEAITYDALCSFCEEKQYAFIRENNEQAVERIFEESPNLVIACATPANAPNLSLCQRLKSDARSTDIPLLLLVPEGEPAALFRAYQKGADGVLSTPLQRQQTRQTIERLVHSTEDTDADAYQPNETISLLDLLRVCQEERLNGTIYLSTLGPHSAIQLSEGEILSVESDVMLDEHVIGDILSWTWEEGHFTVEATESEFHDEDLEPLAHTTDQTSQLLVVDHDATHLGRLIEALETHYTVFQALDGTSALQILQQHGKTLDTVIADANMPDLSGLDLLTQVRQASPHLQVIVMVEENNTELGRLMTEQGALCYIQKPIEVKHLIQHVERALQSRSTVGFRGEVQTLNLVDIVQMYCMGCVRAGLRIARTHNGTRERGIIYFENGQITDVQFGSLEPEAAFRYLLSWTHGDFTTEYGISSRQKTIFKSWQGLLLDAAKHHDEEQRAGANGSRPSIMPARPAEAAPAMNEEQESTPDKSIALKRKEVNPMATKSEQLQDVLQNIKAELNEAEVIAIVAPDGTVYATNASESDANKIGAMVATFIGLSKRACQTLKKGEPMEGLIKGDAGYIAIYPAGKKADLGITTQQSSNLAMLNMVCRDAAEQIREILG